MFPGTASNRRRCTALYFLDFSYRTGHTWLHRANPVAKLVALFCLSLLVFTLPNPGFQAVLFFLTLAAAAYAGIGGAFWLKKLRFVLFFGLTVFLAQLLFNQTGPALAVLVPGRLPITARGLVRGLSMALRLLSITGASYVFTATTDPGDLAYALMQAGLPYRYGFMLVTALRFVPLLREEAATVYAAQLAKGIPLDRPTPANLPQLARYMFWPLTVAALEKVDTLAISMEGRAFGLYCRRTYLRQCPFTWADAVLIALSLIGTAGLLALSYLLPGLTAYSSYLKFTF
ncbi:MAG: energy-coupling factor transport system permease protein [Bacillota bacterium]|nr:energy-coupling factor transport system permease protein [Bacillota bacterium]MDK2926068.1 energy-coupling factor transport system permease protein [Bacillota bacterium]